jgi:integrase
MRTIQAHAVKGTGKYRVRVPATDQKPKHEKWFTTKEQADGFARRVNDERNGRIEELYRLDRTSQALLVHALQKAGSAQAVLDAVNAAGDPVKPQTIRGAVDALIADREDAGRSKDYISALKWTLGKFAFGRNDLPISLVTTQHVRDWLKAMAGTPDMRRSYITRIRGLFKFAIAEKWTRENPAKIISLPERGDSEPEIYTPEQCKALLDAAMADKAILTYYALCMFAGLRPSEARRLRPEHIKADVIRVPIEVARKKKECRNIVIRDALREYLAIGEPLPITRNWKKRSQAVSKASSVLWIQDGMRHSFVSYHAEFYGWEETVKQAGHSLAMMVEHYRALVTEAEARKFWAILPGENSLK